MKCGVKCPRWHFTLRLREPICKKYGMPIPEAWDKCFAVTGPGKARKRSDSSGPAEAKSGPATRAGKWPGTMRGFGPITMKIEGE